MKLSRARARRPSLPRQLDRLSVHGLRVADARIDLRFERVQPDSVALTDVRIDGDVDVSLEVSAEASAVP